MLVYEKEAIYLHGDLSRIDKNRHFGYVRALITPTSLRGKDAQCLTEESP